MREGYLNAIMAMQINAGEFTKIIGTKDKHQSQILMERILSTGDIKAGSGMGIGGFGFQSDPDAQARNYAAMEFVYGKGNITRSKEGSANMVKQFEDLPDGSSTPMLSTAGSTVDSANASMNWLSAQVDSGMSGVIGRDSSNPTGYEGGGENFDVLRQQAYGRMINNEAIAHEANNEKGRKTGASALSLVDQVLKHTTAAKEIERKKKEARGNTIAAGVVDESQEAKFTIELKLDPNIIADFEKTKGDVKVIAKMTGVGK